MINQKKPASGEFYQHFKGMLYQIMTIAIHSETGEDLVIYQALYGDYCVYARPLSMFLSKVDQIKYPDVTQQYRFEKVSLPCKSVKEPQVSLEEEICADVPETTEDNGSLSEINPVILDFLDAELPEDKLNILNKVKTEDLDQGFIDTLAISLDFTADTGSLNEGFLSIKHYLQTLQKYNGRRLR